MSESTTQQRPAAVNPQHGTHNPQSNGPKQASAPKAAAPKAPKVAKPKAEPKPRTHGGFRDQQVITIGKDKDGQTWGPEHNPKRAGSDAHKLFTLYRQGMTVADFVKAGGTGAALKYDSTKGYITVK